MRTLGTIGSTVGAVALFAIAIGFVAIRISGMATFVVIGASMEPTIDKGALVLVSPVSPTTLQVGDIITFTHYDQITTHRVVAIDATKPSDPVFTTKGDANPVADPDPLYFPGEVGLVRAAVPFVGYGVAYLQYYWRIGLMAIAALVFFGCAAAVVFRPRPQTAREVVKLRPVLVPVETDEVWATHLAWLRQATPRRTRAA